MSSEDPLGGSVSEDRPCLAGRSGLPSAVVNVSLPMFESKLTFRSWRWGWEAEVVRDRDAGSTGVSLMRLPAEALPGVTLT